MEFVLSDTIVIVSFIAAFFILIRFIKNSNLIYKKKYPGTNKNKIEGETQLSIKKYLFWLIFGIIIMIIFSLFYFIMYTGDEAAF